jgi:flagellar protein FliO/FliZ
MIDPHNRQLIATALITVASCCSVAAHAAEAAPGVGTSGVLKALLALAVVLVAVLAIAWVARRISPTSVGGSSLKLQGGLSVGTRERVMLVEIKDTWLVLGVAPGRVNLLHSLPRPEDAPAATSVTTSNNGNFAAWLSNAIKRQSNA